MRLYLLFLGCFLSCVQNQKTQEGNGSQLSLEGGKILDHVAIPEVVGLSGRCMGVFVGSGLLLSTESCLRRSRSISTGLYQGEILSHTLNVVSTETKIGQFNAQLATVEVTVTNNEYLEGRDVRRFLPPIKKFVVSYGGPFGSWGTKRIKEFVPVFDGKGEFYYNQVSDGLTRPVANPKADQFDEGMPVLAFYNNRYHVVGIFAGRYSLTHCDVRDIYINLTDDD